MAINYNLKRKEIAEDPRLGVMLDTDLGKEHGVSKSFARNVRVSLGIPPTRKRNIPAPPPLATNKVLEHKGLMGVYSDNSIAKALGVHRSSVTRAREKLGIERGTQQLASGPSQWQSSYLLEWGVIPERRGKTRNQWMTFCKQLSA